MERFYCFSNLKDSTADAISASILNELNLIFPEHCGKEKLIAQSYDGASVMRGASGGVQKQIRDIYPNAHYVHCYAHQLNLIMEQAASKISRVRIFFKELGGITAFFSRSPKRTEVLEQIVAKRIPRGSATHWNFNIRAINIIHEHRDDLVECMKSITEDSTFDSASVCEAKGFTRTLAEFLF